MHLALFHKIVTIISLQMYNQVHLFEITYINIYVIRIYMYWCMRMDKVRWYMVETCWQINILEWFTHLFLQLSRKCSMRKFIVFFPKSKSLLSPWLPMAMIFAISDFLPWLPKKVKSLPLIIAMYQSRNVFKKTNKHFSYVLGYAEHGAAISFVKFCLPKTIWPLEYRDFFHFWKSIAVEHYRIFKIKTYFKWLRNSFKYVFGYAKYNAVVIIQGV